MSFRYIRKQPAEYRTQETCQSINQSAVLSDFHDTQPEGQYSRKSQLDFESCLWRIECRVHDSRKYLRISQENYFYKGDNKGDDKESYPDVI